MDNVTQTMADGKTPPRAGILDAMSLKSPLGATQGGSFEFARDGLALPAARSRQPLGPDRSRRCCWARARRCRSAPRTPICSCPSRSARSPAGSPASSVIPVSAWGRSRLVLLLALIFGAYAIAGRPRRAALGPHGARQHRRAARARPARAAAAVHRRVQLPGLRADVRRLRRQPVSARSRRPSRSIRSIRSSAPSGAARPPPTGRCSPLSAPCSRRSRSPPASSPTRRSPPSRAWSIVALVWNTARLRGLDPVKAVALVGLNPLVVIYGVGRGPQRSADVGIGAGGESPCCSSTATGPAGRRCRRPPRSSSPPGCSPRLPWPASAAGGARSRRRDFVIGAGRRRARRRARVIRRVRQRVAAPAAHAAPEPGAWRLAQHPGLYLHPTRAWHYRPRGRRRPRLCVRRSCSAGWCAGSGAESWTGSTAPLGDHRAAGHRQLAAALVRRLADAARRPGPRSAASRAWPCA